MCLVVDVAENMRGMLSWLTAETVTVWMGMMATPYPLLKLLKCKYKYTHIYQMRVVLWFFFSVLIKVPDSLVLQ